VNSLRLTRVATEKGKGKFKTPRQVSIPKGVQRYFLQRVSEELEQLEKEIDESALWKVPLMREKMLALL
jgi:hypothetical protein